MNAKHSGEIPQVLVDLGRKVHNCHHGGEWCSCKVGQFIGLMRLEQAECRFCGIERGVAEGEYALCDDGNPHLYLWVIGAADFGREVQSDG